MESTPKKPWLLWRFLKLLLGLLFYLFFGLGLLYYYSTKLALKRLKKGRIKQLFQLLDSK